jgi:hypothetical protein
MKAKVVVPAVLALNSAIMFTAAQFAAGREGDVGLSAIPKSGRKRAMLFPS